MDYDLTNYQLTNDEQFYQKYMVGEELEIREFNQTLDVVERPEKYFDISPYSLSLLSNVRSAFQKAGWDSTGDLGIIHVLPFVSDPAIKNDPAYQIGTFMWYVMQPADKKSFLGVYPKSLKTVVKKSDKINNE